MQDSKEKGNAQGSAQPANKAALEKTEGLDSPHIQALQHAAERLQGHVLRTPTFRNAQLDRFANAEIWFKAENVQHISAFKARGAYHFMDRLDPHLRARGVVTYSSGNHGQAVAWAARNFGIPAHVAMPVDAPQIKRQAVVALGATILDGGYDFEYRKQVAEEFAKQHGKIIVPPFDHLDIIAGQGTATLEFLEDFDRLTQRASLEALFVPVGGGGVIAGACLASRAFQTLQAHPNQETAIYSVEPVGCDAMAQSLRASQRIKVSSGKSIADGLRPSRVGELNFRIAKQSLAGSFCVTEQQIGEAWVALLLLGKILVEPSAAAAFAGAICYLQQRASSPQARPRIGVMLTGGNIDPLRINQLIDQHHAACSDHLVQTL